MNNKKTQQSQKTKDKIQDEYTSKDYDNIVDSLRRKYLSTHNPKQRQAEITQDFIDRGLANSTAHVSTQLQTLINHVKSLIKYIMGSLESGFRNVPLFKFRNRLLALADEECQKIFPAVNNLLLQAGLASENSTEQYKQKINKEIKETKTKIQTACDISEKRDALIKRAVRPNDSEAETEIKTSSETRTDKWVKKIKNHPVISFLIIIGIVIIGVGAVVKSIDSIVTFYNKIASKETQSEIQADSIIDKSILTATSTVEITIRSDEEVDTQYAYSGASLAFGKGKEALLVMSSKECKAKQTGTGGVRYRSTLNMQAMDKGFKQPLSLLEEAEYLQISLQPIPPDSDILSGKAIFIFNNNISIEIQIPSQKMRGKLIIIRNMDPILAVLKQLEK